MIGIPDDGAKRAMRRDMKRLLSSMPAERFMRAGAEILERLRSDAVWRESRTICAFLSMASEIDTDALCAAAVGAGKRLCLPRTEGGDLSFRVSDAAGPWSQGPFGIREPLPDAVPVDFSRADGPVLVVVPGLAFDRAGGRLGRGKGFYDRFLRSLRALRPDVVAVGIGLGEQLVPEVPSDERDERLDRLIVDAIP